MTAPRECVVFLTGSEDDRVVFAILLTSNA